MLRSSGQMPDAIAGRGAEQVTKWLGAAAMLEPDESVTDFVTEGTPQAPISVLTHPVRS